MEEDPMFRDDMEELLREGGFSNMSEFFDELRKWLFVWADQLFSQSDALAKDLSLDDETKERMNRLKIVFNYMKTKMQTRNDLK